MNKRIKKKKWKQAAARSRADRLEEIRRFGEDNAIVARHCFIHWAIFGEQLLSNEKLWEAYCAAVMIARAEQAAQAAQAAQVKEWQLSERELWLIEQLNKRKDAD